MDIDSCLSNAIEILVFEKQILPCDGKKAIRSALIHSMRNVSAGKYGLYHYQISDGFLYPFSCNTF